MREGLRWRRRDTVVVVVFVVACAWHAWDRQSASPGSLRRADESVDAGDADVPAGFGPGLPAGFHATPVTLVDEASFAAFVAGLEDARPVPEGVLDPLSGRTQWIDVRRDVVDQQGDPVVGAEVRVVPEGLVLAELGLPTWPNVYPGSRGQRIPEIPRDLLPRAVTRASGGFDLFAPAYSGPGAWRFEAPATWAAAPSNAALIVEAPGFATHVDWVGEPPHAPWYEPRVATGPVVLAPASQVLGRLLDEQGRPIAGAEVRLAAESSDDPVVCLPGVHTARSDAAGVFRLGPLEDRRRLFVDVRAPGFAPRLVGVTATGVDDEVEAADIVLERSQAISGVVRDTNGRPASNARVFASVAGRRGSGVSDGDNCPASAGDDVAGLEWYRASLSHTVWADVDERGRFRVDVGPHDASGRPATYIVCARLEGHELAVSEAVLPGTTDLELLLREQSSLFVELVDAVTGEPYEPVSFVAGRYIGPRHLAALTVVSRRVSPSRWLLEGVGPNGTLLVFRHPPDDPSNWRRSFRLVAGQPVGTTARGVVRVPREATIEARLLGGPWARNDRPWIWAARLGVNDDDFFAGNGHGGRVDEDGRHEIANLRALRVLVGHFGEGHASCPRIPLDTSAGGTYRIDLRCTAAPATDR